MNKFDEAIKVLEAKTEEVAKTANQAGMKNDKEINLIYTSKLGVYREILTLLNTLKQQEI